MITATANAVREPCGCCEWDEWAEREGAWLHRRWRCLRHEAPA